MHAECVMGRWSLCRPPIEQRMGSCCTLYRVNHWLHPCMHAECVTARPFVVQTTHQTAHGQLLDLTTSPPGSQDLSKFTINNYMRIVTFKTAYYSFYMPVACGMLLSGITEPDAFQTAKDILLVMGQYFQVGVPLFACQVLLCCHPRSCLASHSLKPYKQQRTTCLSWDNDSQIGDCGVTHSGVCAK